MSLLRTIVGLLLLPFVLVAVVIAYVVCAPEPEPEYELDCGWWG